jgi:hypothetical protein
MSESATTSSLCLVNDLQARKLMAHALVSDDERKLSDQVSLSIYPGPRALAAAVSCHLFSTFSCDTKCM